MNKFEIGKTYKNKKGEEHLIIQILDTNDPRFKHIRYPIITILNHDKDDYYYDTARFSLSGRDAIEPNPLLDLLPNTPINWEAHPLVKCPDTQTIVRVTSVNKKSGKFSGVIINDVIIGNRTHFVSNLKINDFTELIEEN